MPRSSPGRHRHAPHLPARHLGQGAVEGVGAERPTAQHEAGRGRLRPEQAHVQVSQVPHVDDGPAARLDDRRARPCSWSRWPAVPGAEVAVVGPEHAARIEDRHRRALVLQPPYVAARPRPWTCRRRCPESATGVSGVTRRWAAENRALTDDVCTIRPRPRRDRAADHVAGAAGVGGQDLGGPAAAHGDDGGGVQHPVTAVQRGVHRGGVGDVALHDLGRTDPVRGRRPRPTFAGSRASSRTSWPASVRATVANEPMNPVPPVTRMRTARGR